MMAAIGSGQLAVGWSNDYLDREQDRASGRLLGAQMAGPEGVAKRIDVLATALHAGMTVEQVAQLDLSYAPPFSTVWDPVLVAAQEMLRELRR